jgi:3-hydroxyacyl-CoA dehydrogenase
MSSLAQPLLEPHSTTEPEIANRRYTIGRVAVLGAGTMGARIAAHIANAGLPVLLLDMVPATGERNSLLKQAIANLKSGKPAAFASPVAAGMVSIGNFEDDLAKLRGCDWVIEAVAEKLEIKRNLLAKVAEHLHPNAILTTNTSGLPVARIAERLPEDLRRRWFGTHFFNPPRYMRLLEIISTPEADQAAVQAISAFGDSQLGKEVVPANDVQNFIANRVGTFSLLNTFKIMQEQELVIEEVDVLTGQAIGWPKSGTFRLSDMVGIDVLGNVARNFFASASDERPDVILPQLFSELMERKWLGDKTRQGFYKKDKGANGKEIRLVLDTATFEYKPAVEVSIASINEVKKIEPLAARLQALLAGDPVQDKAAKFYWQALPELWSYSANRIGEVTETLVDIDRAMTAGFNWELGPFAMWDAAGVEYVVAKMRKRQMPIPVSVEKLLAAGGTSWYRANGAEYFDVPSGTYRPVKRNAEHASVSSYKQSGGVFAGNDDISLIDIGEGIGCFELHSKMNSLGEGIVDFLRTELQPDSRAVRNFHGFVIATDAQNFSVGANLKQLLAAAQNAQWDDIRLIIERFQSMTQAIKFCPRPVVAAPVGLCLGGGCEISMHSARRQTHFELYTGLVETGVGLIPGGGGCKEMLLRAIADADRVKVDARGESVEIVETLRNVFETIIMAKVSTSASEALTLRLISDSDSITMNRSRLISDARTQVLRLLREGFSAPRMRDDIPAPGTSVFSTLKLGIYLLREGEYISEHEVKIATHVAKALTGGDITPGTLIGEQHLLDLEREAFISLCAEPKTLERIAFTLKTGKPLRN